MKHCHYFILALASVAVFPAAALSMGLVPSAYGNPRPAKASPVPTVQAVAPAATPVPTPAPRRLHPTVPTRIVATALASVAETPTPTPLPTEIPTPSPDPDAIPDWAKLLQSNYGDTEFQYQSAHYQWNPSGQCFDESNFPGIFHEVYPVTYPDPNWLADGGVGMEPPCHFYFHPNQGVGNGQPDGRD